MHSGNFWTTFRERGCFKSLELYQSPCCFDSTCICSSMTPPRPQQTAWASLIMLLHSSSPLPSTATYSACLCFLSHWKPSKSIALIGLQVAIQRVAPTDHSKVWRPLCNYFRPEVFHYGPRALWRSRVVNHCQRHISVCLGAARTEAFPRPFGKLLPNVDRYQSLQRCLNY